MAWKLKKSRTAMAWLLVAIISCHLGCRCAVAQIPNLTQAPETKEPAPEKKEESKRPLKPWQEEVKTRLQEVEQRIKQLEASDEEAPTAKLKRQKELLSWLDLTLSQLEAEENKSQQLEDYLQTERQQLEKFLQEGISDTDSATFLELDRTRDELASEQRRQTRLSTRVAAVTEALDTARQEQKERASARRLAREGLETNDDDSLRQSLGDDLAEAELFSEISEATVRHRQQELANAKRALSAQEARVKLFREKVARLRSNARFGEEQLTKLFQELAKREKELENKIATAEAAENEVSVLDMQWMQAQQQLDASSGDKDTLEEAIESHKLRISALREKTRLLRRELERLAEHREVWQRRQQAYAGQPSRVIVSKWNEDAEKAIESLESEEDRELLDIEDLQSELDQRKSQLEKGPKDAPEKAGIQLQVDAYEDLLTIHRQNLASIRDTLELLKKLVDELESGSLAATAKDRLIAVWNAVGAVWNYELTYVGERPLTIRKVVTAIALLLAGVIVSRALSRFLGRQVLRRLDIDASASATIQSLFYYTLLTFFALFALNVVRVPLAAFTVLGGAVALGVGFGSQNIINNFISGLILHAERPVKVGDLIQLDELYGNVEHIGARSTRVRTGSNLEIIVPNSSFLQNNVINFTLSSDKVRTSVEVGVIYGSPVVTVTQLLRRAVVETGRVSKDPPPIILFKNFDDSALVFEIHFWIRMRTWMDRLQVESTVRYQVEQLFKEAGIVIAFPQRDMHLDTTAPLSVQVLPPPGTVATEDTPSSRR